jgi:hypothetical protein
VTNKSGRTLEWRVTPKMADIPVPEYQAFWTDTSKRLKSEFHQLTWQFPNADARLKQLLKVIRDIEEMARYTAASVGESEQWSSIVSTAEVNRQNFCKALTGNTMFSALYCTYTVELHDLKAVLKAKPQQASLSNQSPLPPRKMASKKSGGASGTARTRPPRLARKQCIPKCVPP